MTRLSSSWLWGKFSAYARGEILEGGMDGWTEEAKVDGRESEKETVSWRSALLLCEP